MAEQTKFSSDPEVEHFFGLITNPEMKEAGYKEWLKEPGALGELNLKGAGPPPKRAMIWETTRKVFGGKDPLNYPQLIGDCVSFGVKNALEYLQLVMIAMGKPIEFKYLFPPYFYGVSRVLIGGQRGSYQDGSIGARASKGCLKYGMLRSDTEGCPKYSKDVAKEWGAKGPSAKFLDIGDNNLVKSSALVNHLEAAKLALSNFYPITVASSIGFDLKQRSDGLMYNTTSWAHQMLCLGYDEGESDGSVPAHACILNNWGPDIHGKIIDYRTKEVWPAGTLRIPIKTLGVMLGQNDSFTFSDLDGFEAQELPFDFFRPW